MNGIKLLSRFALSGSCYPDAVLGSLPNLYINNAGVGTEATLAKRRSNAVIIDHLPPVYTSIDSDAMQLLRIIGEYLAAAYIKSDQAEVIEQQLRCQLAAVKGAKKFIENVKGADASYDTTDSKSCDILACDFGASVQGGFGLVRKILQGKGIRQYHGSAEKPGTVKVQGLKEKLNETLGSV
jgi:cobalamin biosynthesis Mg chelatase CobN